MVTKFKPLDKVKPNTKAPLYLKSRFDKGTSFEIASSLGQGYYLIIDTKDKRTFKVASCFIDLIPTEQAPKGCQSVIDTLKNSEPDNKNETNRMSLSDTVQKFIESTESKIKSIEETIKPQQDLLINFNIAIVLAEKLNRVPSPKVYKLMHELVQLNPDLGNLPIMVLYLKAENVLESTINA